MLGEESEQTRKLSRFTIYMVLILLVIAVLLRSLFGILPQAKQQLAQEVQNAWINQLSMLRSRWISNARTSEIRVIFQSDNELVELNSAGWPSAGNKQECESLWRIILGRSEIEFNNNLAQVEWAPLQQHCQYRFSDTWTFYYQPSRGKVWWQDDGSVET